MVTHTPMPLPVAVGFGVLLLAIIAAFVATMRTALREKRQDWRQTEAARLVKEEAKRV